MDLSRRRLMIGGVALIAAPVIVRAASLMPIRGERLFIDPMADFLQRARIRRAIQFVLDKHHNIIPLDPGPFDAPFNPLDKASLKNLLLWGRFMETGDRVVGRDHVNGADVSTVFLGIDHGWDLTKPPVLFETMVFGGPNNEKTLRYCTWDEAAAGHRDVVAFERQRVIALENKS